MIAQQLAPDSPQGFLHRRNLRNHLGAVAILLNHLLQATDLAIDAAEPLEIRFLDRRVDDVGMLMFIRRSFGVGGRHDRPAPLNRKAVETTLTELKAIAALARIGLSRMPNAG